jgi:hypothetical protein
LNNEDAKKRETTIEGWELRLAHQEIGEKGRRI